MLGCVLFLIACFRPVVVGRTITSWGRRLCRVDNDTGADQLPAVVRAGRYLAQLLTSQREPHGLVDPPTEESDDLFVPLDGHPAPRDPRRVPDILDSADKR